MLLLFGSASANKVCMAPACNKKVSVEKKISPSRVVALRTAMQLTQEQFAERIGVSRNYVSILERGAQSIRSDTPLGLLFQSIEAQAASAPAARDEETLPPRSSPLQEPRGMYLPDTMTGEDRTPVHAVPIRALAEYRPGGELPRGVPVMWLPGSGNYCAVKIRGEAMAPELHGGDLVVVALDDERIAAGQLGLVRLTSGEVVVRRVQRVRGVVRLIAANAGLVPDEVEAGRIDWMRPVIGIWRRVDE